MYETIESRNPGQYWSLRCYDFYKCIFIHIPKTAGISIATSLFGNYGGGHFTFRRYQEIFDQSVLNSYYKFSFVRHPVSRLVSTFNFFLAGGFHDGSNTAWIAENISSDETFDSFVLDKLDADFIHTIPHLTPQYEFLVSKSGSVDMDFIGRMERIDQDFYLVCQKLGLRRELVWRNRSNPKIEEATISREVRQKIMKLYKADFTEFDYK